MINFKTTIIINTTVYIYNVSIDTHSLQSFLREVEAEGGATGHVPVEVEELQCSLEHVEQRYHVKRRVEIGHGVCRVEDTCLPKDTVHLTWRREVRKVC